MYIGNIIAIISCCPHLSECIHSLRLHHLLNTVITGIRALLNYRHYNEVRSII